MPAPSERPHTRRWVGLLLSFIIPGFGLVRAGHPWRGIAWFLGLEFVVLLMVLSFTLSVVPLWLAMVLLGVTVIGQVWMCISARGQFI